MILQSVITCPHCGAAKSETMPTDACRVFYICAGCGAALRPKPGDCCVFCSYGSVPCPPVQAARTAAELGRKGGKARAVKLDAGGRAEIARKGAQSRWRREN